MVWAGLPTMPNCECGPLVTFSLLPLIPSIILHADPNKACLPHLSASRGGYGSSRHTIISKEHEQAPGVEASV